MTSRFPFLEVVAFILKFIGWLTVGGAVLFFYFTSKEYQGVNFVTITTSLSVLLGGLFSVGFGGAIEVLIEIEQNTRKPAAQSEPEAVTAGRRKQPDVGKENDSKARTFSERRQKEPVNIEADEL
jgi:hypothetical protein